MYNKDNGDSWEESTSNSYTFSGLTPNTTFYIKVYVTDDNKRVSGEYSIAVTTSLENLANVCTSGSNLADCITLYYNTYGESYGGLYYHDGLGTYINANQEAGDNSYRYSGANPDNFICFGSDEATCPTDNLYRIIGVFDNKIKLIKYDYAGSDMLGTNGDSYGLSYAGLYGNSVNYRGNKNQGEIPTFNWNKSAANIWSQSNLNKTNLNVNFINYLNNVNSKWVNMIETSTWYVGGISTYNNVSNNTIKNVYNLEVGPNKINTTYRDEIGLMYVSDYGYAASPENWLTALGKYNNSTNMNNNWMFMGLVEWTITRDSSLYNSIFLADFAAYICYGNTTYAYAVRPTFYLKSTTKYISGTGTQDNPYRIV